MAATRSVRLLHLTDLHLHAHPESRMRGVVTYQTFKNVIERVMDDPDPPQIALATGDLVQDETLAGYLLFRKTMERLNIPVFCLPGNHDAPEVMADVLQTPPFQVCGMAHAGAWRLILLSSFSPGDDGGRLPRSELEFLRRALAECADQHVLVSLHHQPVPMGSRWLDGVGLRNADELMSIVDDAPQVRALLWGHVHQASDRRRNHLRLMSTPATCSQFLPNSDGFAVDHRPPGFRWLDLRPDGSIDTQVVWLE